MSIEVFSALHRRVREGRLTLSELQKCCQQVQTLKEDWTEVNAQE